MKWLICVLFLTYDFWLVNFNTQQFLLQWLHQTKTLLSHLGPKYGNGLWPIGPYLLVGPYLPVGPFLINRELPQQANNLLILLSHTNKQLGRV
jgi:hypothetical protein